MSPLNSDDTSRCSKDVWIGDEGRGAEVCGYADGFEEGGGSEEFGEGGEGREGVGAGREGGRRERGDGGGEGGNMGLFVGKDGGEGGEGGGGEGGCESRKEGEGGVVESGFKVFKS